MILTSAGRLGWWTLRWRKQSSQRAAVSPATGQRGATPTESLSAFLVRTDPLAKVVIDLAIVVEKELVAMILGRQIMEEAYMDENAYARRRGPSAQMPGPAGDPR